MISDNIKYIMSRIHHDLFYVYHWDSSQRIFPLDRFVGFGLTAKKQGDIYTVPVAMYQPRCRDASRYDNAYLPLQGALNGGYKYPNYAKMFEQWMWKTPTELTAVKIKGKPWYVGNGILLDEHFKAVILCTVDVRTNPNGSGVIVTNPTIHFTSKLFSGKDFVGLRPYITEGMFSHVLTMSPGRFHTGQATGLLVSYRIGDQEDYIIRTPAPPMNVGANELVASLNIHDSINELMI